MAPVEAMASARVVVGTNTSGINFILADFPDCLVPPGDSKALASKLIEVKALGPEARAVLGRRMRAKVVEEYSMPHFIGRYEELYEAMVGGKVGREA
ncbi:MAG: hypothetical protein KF833_03450 [Verrucomicrobiae bacterium]|nr:hypothetical protein [Verrucomicrobiae bacterium]